MMEGSTVPKLSVTEPMQEQIRNRMKGAPDFVIRQFPLRGSSAFTCLYLSSIVESALVDEFVIKPILAAVPIEKQEEYDLDDLGWFHRHIPFVQNTEWSDADEGICLLLEGQCLLIPTVDRFLSFDVKRSDYRSVTEPQSEATVRGPREGFVEDIGRNVALIRKRLKSEHLVFEQMIIGTKTKTKVYLTYLPDIASNGVVYEFRRRLQAIQADSILESSYLEDWIQDKTLSPFPQLIGTERPDAVTGKLLEGQVALLTDGTPIALIGPVTFFQLFSSPEDYYQRPDIATLTRWLRFFAFMLSIFIPPLYIAVVTFHQELLPTLLLINLAAQREAVPFPAFLEAMIMMVTFEILREASLRMPRIAGQSISIVGALVLGMTTVEAGLVSAAMVIVVSITAISNFVSPIYGFGNAQRVLQFVFMFLAGFMGLYGILCGTLFVLVHLVSLSSFGVKYMSPLAPLLVSDFKDTILRVPRFWLNQKPQMFSRKK
ncbi:spore germination protein [Paenibacillus sp. R14(2021)]|uniref:spore germination protein n=1 Tax=Paenibacillus sp. R14(2021) TaxID=2859228 RepID=UPI001C615811|nr:spore germination protein [Paenibacillus sp. R14(2021)]